MLIPILRLVAGAAFGYIMSSSLCEESETVVKMRQGVKDLRDQVAEMKEQGHANAAAANATMDEVLKQQEQLAKDWDDAQKTFRSSWDAMQKRHEDFQKYAQEVQERMEDRSKRISQIEQDMQALDKEIDESLQSLEDMINDEKEPSKESLEELKEKLEGNNVKVK